MADRLVERIDRPIVHNTAIPVCSRERRQISAAKKSVAQILSQILMTAKLWRKVRSDVLKPNHVTPFRTGNLPIIPSIPILKVLPASTVTYDDKYAQSCMDLSKLERLITYWSASQSYPIRRDFISVELWRIHFCR
jgi:hypothetical protein